MATAAVDSTLSFYAAMMGEALPAAPNDVDVFRRYYIGDQVNADELPLAVRQLVGDLLRTRTGHGFSVNLCGLIVNTLVAALNVQSIGTQGGLSHRRAVKPMPAVAPLGGVVSGPSVPVAPQGTAPVGVQDWLWDRWQASGMLAGIDVLATAVAVEQEAYLVSSFDAAGEPVCYVNRRLDNRGHGIEPIEIGPDGELLSAQKRYADSVVLDSGGNAVGAAERVAVSGDGAATSLRTVARSWRIIYEATRIRRYVRVAGEAERLFDDLPWPAGLLPVIRFASPLGGELSPSVLSMQNLVNDAYLSLASLGRLYAYPLPWFLDCKAIPTTPGTSDDPETAADDESRDAVPIQPGTAFMLESMEERKGQVGRIEAADLQPLLDEARHHAETMMMLAQTPSYLLPWSAATPPSGEALKTANSPFEGKVQRYTEHWTGPLERQFALFQAMAGSANEDAWPVWQELSFGSGLSQAQEGLVWQQLEVPAGIIWSRKLGLTPEEIQQASEERAAEQARRAEMASALATPVPAAAAQQQPPADQTAQANGTPPGEVVPSG